MQIDIYVKKTNKTYKTNYGVPFQCVELIRRFFSIVAHVSIPNVVDAVDLFNNTDSLFEQTLSYPYAQNPLKAGSVLFWKRRKPNFSYGHCALIIDSNEKETIVIQQNLNPPIRVYATKDLFAKLNRKDSKFLGVKTVSFRLPKLLCNVVHV
jgi:hypothetical protein